MKLNPSEVNHTEGYIEVRGEFGLSNTFAFSEALKSSNGRCVHSHVLRGSGRFSYTLNFYSYDDYSSFSKTYDILTSPTVEKVRKPKIKVLIRKKFESIIKTLKDLIN